MVPAAGAIGSWWPALGRRVVGPRLLCAPLSHAVRPQRIWCRVPVELCRSGRIKEVFVAFVAGTGFGELSLWGVTWALGGMQSIRTARLRWAIA